MKVKCPTCGFEHDVDASNELRPISVLGYIGYMVLFSLPIIGIVMLLVLSFGGTKNCNLKNFARSFLCIIAVAVILWAVYSYNPYGESGYYSYEQQGTMIN